MSGYRERDRRHAGRPGPRPLAASLGEAARTLGAEGAVEVAAVNACWARVVGPQVAGHAWPEALRHGVLVVVADHVAWASELRALSGDLTRKLQAEGLEVTAVTVSVSHRERPA